MNVATSAVLAHSWLLLIHQIPAKPAYLRVKVWRRLQGIGAIAVKNAVHVLPMNEETQEDFEWLLREIEQGGGEAFVCEARLIDGEAARNASQPYLGNARGRLCRPHRQRLADPPLHRSASPLQVRLGQRLSREAR